MFRSPPSIFLYVIRLTLLAASRGSAFKELRIRDTTSGRTSDRALLISFCKAFCVLGFVLNAASSTSCCRSTTESLNSNSNIQKRPTCGLHTSGVYALWVYLYAKKREHSDVECSRHNDYEEKNDEKCYCFSWLSMALRRLYLKYGRYFFRMLISLSSMSVPVHSPFSSGTGS